MSRHDSGGKVRLKLGADVVSRAVFGGDREEYHHLLRRTWVSSTEAVMFLMMNPSTADIHVDNPTMAKCQRYAQTVGARLTLCREHVRVQGYGPGALA